MDNAWGHHVLKSINESRTKDLHNESADPTFGTTYTTPGRPQPNLA